MNGAAATFFAIYITLQLGIGLWWSRRMRRGDDYFMAGRNLAVLPAAMSLFATWFGAETLMGSSAAIASDGMAGARAEPIGFALCLFAMGLLVAGGLRARGHATLADFFRDRFDARSEKLAAVAIMIGSTVWAAAQLAALGVVLEAAVGVPHLVSLGTALVVVLIYTAMSGLMGNVAVGVVQGTVLLVGLLVLLFAIAARFGGFMPMIDSIEPVQLNLLAADGHWLNRIDAWVIPILGGIVTQEALVRLLATRSPEDARKACYIASLFYLLVGAIPVTIALAGVHLNPSGWNGDNFLPALVQDSLSPIFGLVFLAALVSAILSTVSANVLSIAAVVSMNLMGRFYKDAAPGAQLAIGRIMTIAAGCTALVIALSGTRIYDLVLLSIVLGQGGILVAVLFGLYWRGGGPLAGLAAIIANMACNIATLVIYPLIMLRSEGVMGIGAAFQRISAGEAPALPGYFLLSLLVSILAYVAVAWAEARRHPIDSAGFAASPRLNESGS